MSLSKVSLLDRGYIIHIDNWYNSVRLCEYLITRNTGVRGTVRMNRGIPTELRVKRQLPVSSTFMRNENGVLAIIFTDKRDVYFLSTVDKAGTIQKQRYLPRNRSQAYEKPSAIERYNFGMLGVDLTDQYPSGITAARRAHVWFKKYGIHMIQRLLLNAHIMDQQNDSYVTFLNFS